ncbi:orotidine 5'-phosphate decarboxylase / HUMPS family protein [Amycolatopsis saalfeldensis]|uniref:3-hexulose-6-phosphate synthase n=1 Tax=Amycolatopsis saalfeldensis TaxID=394193 RepID=A0A1H8XX74_9PSEU|nr:orotidine 5'-phosphate decarboxylase / HUMPS family protein [Amycolatopsis saalfeldensis]SEP44489.1 3-hexulose-6-phosphate synthase [Amycolatopsis saalfeldensis]
MSAAPETHLQLALDHTDPAPAERLVELLAPTLRRVEVGTPLVLAAGLGMVARVRALAGGSATVVADVKICDAGEKIARSAVAAGADVLTVVATAIDDVTWRGVLRAAADRDGGTASVVLDTIGPSLDLPALAGFLAAAKESGVPVELCVHRPKVGSPGFTQLIQPVNDHVPGFASLAVAGKLAPAEAGPALTAGFGTLIVGGAVADAADPAAVWAEFRREIARAWRWPG